MSFIFRGNNGLGTIEQTDMSDAGYRDSAKYLVGLYKSGSVSRDDRSYDTEKVLKYNNVKDLEELRIKLGM